MDLRIASRCPKSWDELVGDNRIRYCGQCRLNVYNLAEMNRDEVAEVVRKTEGRLCGRLYVRVDQTATVENCRRSGFRKKIVAALSVAALLLVGGMAWCFNLSGAPDAGIYPSWVQLVLEWIGPRRDKAFLEERMGVMIRPQPKPSSRTGGR